MMFDTTTAPPVLTAARFVLRPLRMSDTGLLDLYAADPRVAQMTKDIPHPLPPGATAALIEKSVSEGRCEDIWAMDGSASGHAEVMGIMRLTAMDRRQSEISYWVAPAFWNAGLATEAVGAVIDANPQGAAQLFAEVFQDNPGSARVLTNSGFAYLGDAEAFSVARAAVVPTWTYALKLD